MHAAAPFRSKPLLRSSRDGATIRIRTIAADDEAALASFEASVSASSIYRRFGEVVSKADRLSHRYLEHLCCTIEARELSLVALREGAIVGLGQLVRETAERAEFALLVADACQGIGIGTHLLQALIAAARDAGVATVEGFISAANAPMLRVCRKLGFAFASDGSPSALVVTLALRPHA